MIILSDREALLRALDTGLPANLHALLANIVMHAAEAGLLDLSFLVVVQCDDTDNAVAEEIGFSPLVDPIDGLRFDHPKFQPYWAHLDHQLGWYRLIHTVSDDGFAFVLLVDDQAGNALAQMCHRFTTEAL